MGLVVVPGHYIEKIEVEEFESQVRERDKRGNVMNKGADNLKVEGGQVAV